MSTRDFVANLSMFMKVIEQKLMNVWEINKDLYY